MRLKKRDLLKRIEWLETQMADISSLLIAVSERVGITWKPPAVDNTETPEETEESDETEE